MKTKHWHRILVAGVAVLLAACAQNVTGSPSAGGRPTLPTQPPTTVVTTTPPTTTTTTTTTQTQVQPPLATSVCTVRDLGVTLRGEDGTAGTMYRGLVFTDTGSRACTIQGFPGVSFVAGADGHQVGGAAIRDGQKGAAITLRPGESATAPVGFRNVGAFDPATCVPTPVLGLRVYPPHERRAEFVSFPTTGCAKDVPGGQLVVLTVHPGSGLG